MANYFEYNGSNSADYGLIVNGVNIFGAPNRIVDKISIPYRNGDLLIDTGVYSNIIVTYTISLLDPSKTRAIADWLLNSRGYCRLYDTYNPTEYRLGACYSDINYQMTMLNRYGQASISFDCKPQRYLLSGEEIENFNADGTLTNPTNYPAQPYIEVYGDGTFYINGQEITLTDNGGDQINIDCETMQCFRMGEDGATNMNASVSMPDGFPVLEIGENTITFGDIEDLYITPRWWRL